MMKKEPFYQLTKKVAENNKIEANARLCYMFLSNRKSMSMTKGSDYFDNNHNDYYVIYSQSEMANIMGLSTKTIGRIYKSLEELGLIKREKFTHTFNSTYKIFITNNFFGNETKMDSEKEVLSAPEKTKEHPSKTDPNKTDLKEDNNTTNTINTKKVEKCEEKYSQITPLESLINSLNDKLKLDSSVIEALIQVTKSDYKKVHKLVGIILNAKKNVVRTSKIGSNNTVTRFENNNNLAEPLADKIRHIFNYAPTEPFQNEKYLMASFKNFFKKAFGLEVFENNTPKMVSGRDVVIKIEDNKLSKIQKENQWDFKLINLNTGRLYTPRYERGWTTREDLENGPDIPIFKIK